MLFLCWCLLVTAWTVHQTLVVDTMSDGKGVAEFVIYNFYQKMQILLWFLFHILLLEISISLLEALFIRDDTHAILDRTEPINRFFAQFFVRVVTIVEQDIGENCYTVGVFRQSFGEVDVKLCCVVVDSIFVWGFYWIELFEIYLLVLEGEKFYLGSVEECFCFFLYLFHCLFT